MVRRFQTKSNPIKQFFKINQNDKKYYHQKIITEISKPNEEKILDKNIF
jgi:hypothetical protein